MVQMSTFISFLILALGIFFALFLFWKLLKDDYEDSDIFTLWFISCFGGVLGYIATGFVFPQDSILVSIILAFVFALGRARKLGMKRVEVVEAGVPASLLFLIFFLGARSLTELSLGIVTEFVLLLGALVLFLLLKVYYRRFLWYPSGRVGFAALVTLVFYFLLRGALLALVTPRTLFLISPLASVIFGLLVVGLSLVVLYIQSGRQDLTRFWLRHEKAK